MPVSHYKLIRFVEYAAVSASVIGAIAAISTKQPVYAIAPLSLSAVLSLVSRQQQQRQSEKLLSHATKQLDWAQQKNVQLQGDVAAVKTSLAEETAKLTQVIEQQAIATTATAETLQSFKQSLNQRLTPLIEETRFIQATLKKTEGKASDWASLSSVRRVEIELETLRSQLLNFAENTAVNKLSQEIQQLTMRNTDELLKPVVDQSKYLESKIVSLSNDLDNIKKQLESVTLQLDTIANEASTDSSGKPDFSRVIPQLPTDEDYDLEINLGIDFGTGFTKVCFRDLAQESSEIVTFSAVKTDQGTLSLEQTLIPTKLAVLEDGTLLTGLTVAEWAAVEAPIHQSIDFIKMRLAATALPSESNWRLEQIPELDDPGTVKSICAFYLSKIIDRAQSWIKTHRPDMFSNRSVRWSVNIGVPVEYCDSNVQEVFEDALSWAWLINCSSSVPTMLTIDQLNQLTTHLQSWMDNNHVKGIQSLDCNVTPEIVAAVWSFLSSRAAQNGFYTFFDIGDGTLDGAAFRFWREHDGALKVDFYAGEVRPLGVTAFTQQAAKELNSSPETIRKALIDTSDVALHGKMQQSQIRRDVQRLVASIVYDGHGKHHDARQIFAPEELGETLKVFVGGGGGNTSFFPKTIESTHADFQQGDADIPPYQIRQIPPPKSLSINGINPEDFNRFAVAYGLCIPSWEGPSIKLPSQIDSMDSPFSSDTSDVTRYEDTRDMM